MLHNFKDYIRHGGNGEYHLARSGSGIVGHRVHLSLKSSFSNYSTLRQAFDESLNKLISKNTQFLLNALTPPDTVPLASEADLLDLSRIKDAALVQWDERVEGIYAKYHSHQQRLRPLRIAMEERLLRAFAGAINQIRQQDLGIERYIWRSRDDDKVRSAHAEYDDQTFRWDKPPAGGHPGQAHNCRCFAEPILPGTESNIVLADFALPTDIPGSALSRVFGRRVVALTPLGAAALLALEASDALQRFTQSMTAARIRNAAETLGVDLDTAEGLLATIAHELIYETVITGIGSNLPKTSNAARIAGQAAALYEMLHPGTILKVVGGDPVAQKELGYFVQSAYEAFEANRLQILDGELAQGWVEVFPELTEEERRLGQLPGFTPERLEQFREEYPIEDLGLPIHTGHGAEEDPVGNIISTPILDETGPNVVTMENPHSIDSVSIPEDRAKHILDGDGFGGGHRAGTGVPGKSEFPVDWSDEDILEAIKEVAGTGLIDRPAHRPKEYVIVGEVNGVTIETVVKPNGEIRTAYPIRGNGVVQNPRGGQ